MNTVSPRPTFTPEAKMKFNTKCGKLGKWGHWHSDNIQNEKLKPSALFRDNKEDKLSKMFVTFNLVNIYACSIKSSSSRFHFRSGPLLDNGGGEQEFPLSFFDIEFNCTEAYCTILSLASKASKLFWN